MSNPMNISANEFNFNSKLPPVNQIQQISRAYPGQQIQQLWQGPWAGLQREASNGTGASSSARQILLGDYG